MVVSREQHRAKFVCKHQCCAVGQRNLVVGLETRHRSPEMKSHITALSHIQRKQVIYCTFGGILSVCTREIIVDLA